MDARPIGVFDSGIGGLTVVHELLMRLPNEDIVYLGDTARLPYGTKSPETVLRFSRENLAFLKRKNVKFVHAADLHIDSPMRGLDRYEGAPASRLRAARADGSLNRLTAFRFCRVLAAARRKTSATTRASRCVRRPRPGSVPSRSACPSRRSAPPARCRWGRRRV